MFPFTSLHQWVYCTLFCFQSSLCVCQNSFFGEGPINWESRKPLELPAGVQRFDSLDLVILNDLVEFYLYEGSKEKVTRTVKYKINTKKGLDELKHFEMPESFDYAYDSELYKQSRRSRIKTPQMKEYTVKVFAARKYSRQHWANVSVKDKYETQRWVMPSGEFSDESRLVFELGSVAIGDVVEIYYEAGFDSQYGTNMFYMMGRYPKMQCEYRFNYRVDKGFTNATFILPVNIDSSKIYTSKVTYENYFIMTTRLQFVDLPANNYPLNCFQSKSLPHVCVDFNYYRSMVSYVDKQFSFIRSVKPKNFEWSIPVDTSIKVSGNIYDKQFSVLKKFISGLPPTGNDSQNVVFCRALSDTLNSFRYISANHLYYNESQISQLSSSDHLAKRRLSGNALGKTYQDILRESKVFYYLVNIQDKRFGEHALKSRSHFGYERNFIALPAKDSFTYFIPRYEGLKYHPGELPFYYEGVYAALIPMNFQKETKNKASKLFKLVKTERASPKENIRIEKSHIKIDMDSLSATLIVDETLSGQFSTLLRPLYLNDYIDSTVALHYYKKCVDKPQSYSKRIKLASKSTTFPYTYTFAGVSKIKFKASTKIETKDWYSFVLSKSVIPLPPNQDFYFDFCMSDSYDFLIEFSKPVEIINVMAFARKIENEYFDLNSEIIRIDPNHFRIQVQFTIKQERIPLQKSSLLMDVVEQLDQLNNFALELGAMK